MSYDAKGAVKSIGGIVPNVIMPADLPVKRDEQPILPGADKNDAAAENIKADDQVKLKQDIKAAEGLEKKNEEPAGAAVIQNSNAG